MNPLALERFVQPLLPYFFGFWMLVVLYFTMAPAVMVQSATNWIHPGFGHMVLFGGWTTLLGFMLLISFQKQQISLIFLWIAGVIFGGLVEVLQSILPFERDGNWVDVGLNAIGCTVAILVVFAYKTWRSSYIQKMQKTN